MRQYLLDTSICVFLFRNKFGIEGRLEKVGKSQCYISEATIAELTYGAYKSNRVDENLHLIDRLFQNCRSFLLQNPLVFTPKKRIVFVL